MRHVRAYVRACVRVCVCVCAYTRERERQRQRQRQRDSERGRDKQRVCGKLHSLTQPWNKRGNVGDVLGELQQGPPLTSQNADTLPGGHQVARVSRCRGYCGHVA